MPPLLLSDEFCDATSLRIDAHTDDGVLPDFTLTLGCSRRAQPLDLWLHAGAIHYEHHVARAPRGGLPLNVQKSHSICGADARSEQRYGAREL
jgi:hypothetical protein